MLSRIHIKVLFLLFLALPCLVVDLYAQSPNDQKLLGDLIKMPLHRLGLDDQPELTPAEASYLNLRFSETRYNFDFTGKRVVFAKGSGARMLITKSNYFVEMLSVLVSKRMVPPEALFVVPDFKQEETGYDALVTIWVQKRPMFNDCIKAIDYAGGQGNPVELDLNRLFNLESMGRNNDPLLNSFESEFFNYKFYKQRNSFDFTNKRVAFVVGTFADTLSSKVSYFEENSSYLALNKLGTFDELLLLSNEEKKLCNGYDAIIVSWRYYNFPLSPNARYRLLRNLAKVSW